MIGFQNCLEMCLNLFNGGSVPILDRKGNRCIIERMFFQDLEDITSITEDDGTEIPITIDFKNIEWTRRRIYLYIMYEENSDSGTLPEQEESEVLSPISDLATEESSRFECEWPEEEEIPTDSDEE